MSTSRSRSVSSSNSGSVYIVTVEAEADVAETGAAAAVPAKSPSIIFSISRFVADGAMIALPWYTVRIELSSVSGSVSFSRKPDAPALIAAITYSSKSNVVRMITRVCASSSALPSGAKRCCNALIRRAASMPSIPGIRTSISTTSGCIVSAKATASAPSRAWPTTAISGWEPITIAKPARTNS